MDEQDVGSGAWADARRAWLAGNPEKVPADYACPKCKVPAGVSCVVTPGEVPYLRDGAHSRRWARSFDYNSERELHAQNAGYAAQDAEDRRNARSRG